MSELNVSGRKHLRLSIDVPDQLCKVSRALSNPLRLQIIQLLGNKSMVSVNDIADSIQVPVSSVALAVRILEEAGLLFTEKMPGLRGTLKLSSRKVDSLSIDLTPYPEHTGSILTMHMPVGGYTQIGRIKPTCGLAGLSTMIGMDDNPRTFYQQERFGAQLLWFREGFVEYMFSVLTIDEIDIDWLELSFEACSEAPMYRDPWESDICVSINGKALGIWTSPCDCGEHRGKLNPAWWSDLSTQHGFFKTWRVDMKGSHLDNLLISGTTLADLGLYSHDAITIRIEVPENSENVGGLNLFGEHFGDFAQDIVLQVGYHMKDVPDSKE